MDLPDALDDAGMLSVRLKMVWPSMACLKKRIHIRQCSIPGFVGVGHGKAFTYLKAFGAFVQEEDLKESAIENEYKMKWVEEMVEVLESEVGTMLRSFFERSCFGEPGYEPDMFNKFLNRVRDARYGINEFLLDLPNNIDKALRVYKGEDVEDEQLKKKIGGLDMNQFLTWTNNIRSSWGDTYQPPVRGNISSSCLSVVRNEEDRMFEPMTVEESLASELMRREPDPWSVAYNNFGTFELSPRVLNMIMSNATSSSSWINTSNLMVRQSDGNYFVSFDAP